MQDAPMIRAVKWLAAWIIGAPALIMPYQIRTWYLYLLSGIIHAPLRTFGSLSAYILDALNIEALQESEPASAPKEDVDALLKEKSPTKPAGSAVILFSGGTDSTCTAAVMARRFSNLHLLTFYEKATAHSPIPTKNIGLLQNHFKDTSFTSHVFSIDPLVRYFSYERYFTTLRKHGLLVLGTPGYSTLSWHVRTILFCLENNITHVADGLTRELMHFPGHMDAVVVQMKELYAHFGIEYENPVREWSIPPDRQLIDQVLVNRHPEYVLGGAPQKTTGEYLYRLGIFARPNMKGSKEDFTMQHDCYPFSLYNIITFWGFLPQMDYSLFCAHVSVLMRDKIARAHALIEEHRATPAKSRIGRMRLFS